MGVGVKKEEKVLLPRSERTRGREEMSVSTRLTWSSFKRKETRKIDLHPPNV